MTKPYYQDDAVTIYHGDCREILPTLPKFDLVLTDPPYKVISGGRNSKTRPRGGWMENYNNSGDIVSGALPWPEIAKLCWDACVDECDIYVMTNNLHVATVQNSFEHQGFKTHNWLVWDKKTVTPNRWYMKNCEFIYYGYKGLAKSINDCGSKQLFSCFQNDETEHPTEKPVRLMANYISNSTMKGQTILDPFMGSGTTLRAAKDLGRKATGIEIEEKYCEIAAKRMAQEVLAL